MKMTDAETVQDQEDKIWRMMIEVGLRIEDLIALADRLGDIELIDFWEGLDKQIKDARIEISKKVRWPIGREYR
jgi:hypothetical protein